MSDQIGLEEKVLNQSNASSSAVESENDPGACKMQGKRWLRGSLAMILCCSAPFLALSAIALFGISQGALVSGFLSIAAVLACPVGMYLMMRMMMKNKSRLFRDRDY